MSQTIRIKRGLDIPLEGKASSTKENVQPDIVGIVPEDFTGHTWKCAVKPGDSVSEGSPLLEDKLTGKIKIVSPVSGKVEEIRRGERRKILAVVVKRGDNIKSEAEYDLSLSSDIIRGTLLTSGLWAMIRQRPFDIVPDPDSDPRDIYVTGFDSAPLAPDLYFSKEREYIERGLEVLRVITGKKPYISIRDKDTKPFINGETLYLEGPHPAGNVSVQIASSKPINKGETVWTLNVRTLVCIGRLYTDGICKWETEVALTGPEFKEPHIVGTVIGASIAELIKGQLRSDDDIRVISGNVLTGHKVDPKDGFLRYPYYQITAIKEGSERDEFMGWASMNPLKFSVKRTFPAFLRGLSKPFAFDSRIKGGRRAMILSGELDKVFPFDIYPEYLIRAMQAGDIDKMEKLGIYEIAPEDFALPEFVDTSKQELQQLVRDSLDKIRSEE